MPEKNFSLKDQLFNENKLNKIAGEIKAVYPAFDKQKFVNDCVAHFPALELKERIVCISENLKKRLPQDFKDAVGLIIHALPAPCDPNLADNDFGDFIYAAYAEFVASYGCDFENLECALEALEAITMRFSAEYAIRSFINTFPEQTFDKLNNWCEHKHYHVRRLACEGTRPKLPWGKNIQTPIEQALPILDVLHADTTRFVTRSVANHLNDISKSQPDVVVQLLEKWRKEKRQNPKELEFITKHALRTLIKNGHQKALDLIGFKEPQSNLKIELFSIDKVVKINDNFSFSFQIHSPTASDLLIDYGIHFQTKNGLGKKAKIFKLKQLKLSDNQCILIEKSHPFRGNMTTRNLQLGEHQFFLQINGHEFYRAQFELIEG